MRKVIKKITKEIQDTNAVVVTGPMLEKLLTYTKESLPSAADITKCIDALMKLSEEGDTVGLEHYADFVALVK